MCVSVTACITTRNDKHMILWLYDMIYDINNNYGDKISFVRYIRQLIFSWSTRELGHHSVIVDQTKRKSNNEDDKLVIYIAALKIIRLLGNVRNLEMKDDQTKKNLRKKL